MDKKKVITIVIFVAIAAFIIRILFFYFNPIPIEIGQEMDVTPVDESQIYKEPTENYECEKKGTFTDIVVGDLNIEAKDDEDSIEDENTELTEDSTEVENKPIDISKYKDNTIANVGKVKISEKVTITYYSNYQEISGIKTFEFSSNEGFNKYRVDKYSGDDEITSQESNLTKTQKYKINKIEYDSTETQESHIKNSLSLYEKENYICKKVS